MPIMGMTDRDSVDQRYPTVGRLYKGAPKPESGKAPGRDQAHFRFVGATEAITAHWNKTFTETPKILRAFLPYSTTEENFGTWIEKWTGGGRLVWRSDGARTVRRWLEEEKVYSDRVADQKEHKELVLKDSSQVGRLALFFPELLSAGHVGTVLLTTHGKHDLGRISAALFKLEQDCIMRDEGLKYIEVTIERRKVTHADPDGKKRGHFDVFLSPSEKWVMAQLERAREELPQITATVIDHDTGEILYDGEEVIENEDPVPSPERPAKAPVQRKTVPTPKAGAKIAKVKGAGRWPVMARELADDHPAYMLENGSPDYALMLERAASLGYDTITEQNVETVIKVLGQVAKPDPETDLDAALTQEAIPF